MMSGIDVYKIEMSRVLEDLGVEFRLGCMCIQLCPTLCDPWTVACQTPLSMGFSRQEYWSG